MRVIFLLLFIHRASVTGTKLIVIVSSYFFGTTVRVFILLAKEVRAHIFSSLENFIVGIILINPLPNCELKCFIQYRVYPLCICVVYKML